MRTSAAAATSACLGHAHLPAILAILGTLGWADAAARAQVVRDNTLGAGRNAAVPLGPGGVYRLGADLGRRSGPNLFHSFARFDVPAGAVAEFTGPADVRRVIARVTGGGVSHVDGTVRNAIPGADTYLINPAGWVFGKAATLDVTGGFAATTADALVLAGGARFGPGTDDAVLLSADPAAFGFTNARPGTITVNGAQLAVAQSKALTLAGGDVTVTNAAAVAAPAGALNVVSVASAGTLAVDADKTDGFATLGTLKADGGSLLDASGPRGGRVRIRSGTLTLANAKVQSNTTGSGDGLGIDVNVRGDATLTGASGISAETRSAGRASAIAIASGGTLTIDPAGVVVGAGTGVGIFSECAAGASGAAGDVTISAAAVALLRGADVDASTSGVGAGGNVRVAASGSLTIDGGGAFTPVSSTALVGSTADAGTVDVRAGGDVTIRAGGLVRSDAYGSGNAGDVLVSAGRTLTIESAGSTLVTGLDSSAEPGSTGDAGRSAATARDVTIRDGGVVQSTTFAAGRAGDASAVASGTLTIDGAGATGFTGIASTVTAGATGAGGTATASAGDATIRNGGTVQSDTFGVGRAGAVRLTASGTLTIDRAGSALLTGLSSSSNSSATGDAGTIVASAGDVVIRAGGIVQSNTAGSGRAGDARVTATRTILIDGVGATSFTGVASGTVAGSTGAGGTAAVSGGDVVIRAGGAVQSSTFGSGNAGGASATATRTLTIDGVNAVDANFTGVVSDAVAGSTGDAGTASVAGGDVVIRDGGNVSSSTRGPGRGGDASVVAARSVTIDGGANAFFTGVNARANAGSTGDGGTASVTAVDVTIRDGSEVASDTYGSGRAGGARVTASGNLTIDGVGSEYFTGVSSDAIERSTGDAGTTIVSAGQIVLKAGGQVRSDTGASGHAGDVNVTARGDLTIDGAGAGDFTGISSDTESTGDAGQVTVTAGGRLTLAGADTDFFTSIESTSEPEMGRAGAAGLVSVTAGSLAIRGTATINSDTAGRGIAGEVHVTVDGPLTIDGPTDADTPTGITSDSFANGNADDAGAAGEIRVRARRVTITGSGSIESDAYGAGDAGDVDVGVAGALTIDGSASGTDFVGLSSVSLRATDDGRGGDAGRVTVHAGSLELLASGEISTSTDGTGRAGDVTIATDGAVTIDRLGGPYFTGVRSDCDAGATGDAGTVAITAHDVLVRGGGQVLSNTVGAGNAGSTRVAASGTLKVDRAGSTAITSIQSACAPASTGDAGQTFVSARDVVVRNGGSISSDTFSVGRAGGVTVTARGTLTIDRAGSPLFTGISSDTELAEGPAGDAGTVSVSAGDASILRGGSIRSNTFGVGRAGDVTLAARGALIVDGADAEFFTGLDTSSRNVAVGGDAGEVSVDVGSLSILGGGSIRSATFGTGRAGSVSATVAGTLTIDGQNFTDVSTGLSSTANAGSVGNAGVVNAVARDVTIRAGGIVRSDTSGLGSAGSVAVTATGAIAIDGSTTPRFTGISSDANVGAGGAAGDIDVRARTLTVGSGGAISTSTYGPGRAGTVEVVADAVSLDGDRGRRTNAIRSASRGAATGDAGVVVVRARTIDATGHAGISSSSEGGGDAGDVHILGVSDDDDDATARRALGRGDAPAARVALDYGAFLASEADGSGRAGSVAVDARSLTLDGGASVSALAAHADGGDATLRVQRLLVLRDGASITATAAGNGGNVRVADPTFLVLEHSSITANADTGNGGGVDLSSRFTIRSPFTPITALSRTGAQGIVTVESDVLDLSHEFILPPIATAAGELTLQPTCGRRADDQTSTFVARGSGAVPSSLGGWVPPTTRPDAGK